jgi:hypothetical protein
MTPTISEWLHALKLENLIPNFLNAGYDDYDFIIAQMFSRHPISDTILAQDIGIRKPGYRARILARLQDEIAIKTTTTNVTDLSMDLHGKNTACEMCALM